MKTTDFTGRQSDSLSSAQAHKKKKKRLTVILNIKANKSRQFNLMH